MTSLIYGRNPVKAAIKSGQTQKIYVAINFDDKEVLSLANKNHIEISRVDKNVLNNLVKAKNAQGVVAEVMTYKYYSLVDLINDGMHVKNPIIVMLDGINDPHNLGAILRIADAFNVVGVVIRNNKQVPLNATVAKVSTGAISYVKVAQVNNLNIAIKKLKDNGYWIISTDGEAKESYFTLDYNMPLVLVIGSEGRGISRLVKENSDFLIKINMFGHVNSLNASNALSVILSHVVNSRLSPK